MTRREVLLLVIALAGYLALVLVSRTAIDHVRKTSTVTVTVAAPAPDLSGHCFHPTGVPAPCP